MSLFWLIATVVIYLGIVAYLGYQGYSSTKNSSDYLVGGRNIHPYVMAMSYGATFISTSAIVGFSGIASLFGMSLHWLTFANIAVGILIAFVFYGKRTRRMGLNLDAHTFPEFLGRRLESRFIQRLMGLVIFVFMPLYAAAVLIGASRIIEGLLGIPYLYSVAIFSVLVAAYVIMGGLKGVMYTDALQGSLMFFGMLILLFFIYLRLGGVGSAHRALSGISDLVPENLVAIGHQGWTASPKLWSPLWWTIYSSLVLGVGIGTLAQPQLVVRYMTVRSNKELNRAVIIGGVFILATVGTAYTVGSLSNVYFLKETGTIAIAAVGGNSDKVMPAFIASAMPSWFGYLFMLVILSAGMSTLSSQFHAIGTSIGRDFYAGGAGGGKRGTEILITRIGILCSILLTVFLALNMGAGIIARATAIFFGLMASCFLAPYTAALFWKRLTKAGALAGIFSGLLTAGFSFFFLHGKEAALFGISQAFFGRPTLLGGAWPAVDPLVLALPTSVLFTIVGSLLSKPADEKHVALSFEGID